MACWLGRRQSARHHRNAKMTFLRDDYLGCTVFLILTCLPALTWNERLGSKALFSNYFWCWFWSYFAVTLTQNLFITFSTTTSWFWETKFLNSGFESPLCIIMGNFSTDLQARIQYWCYLWKSLQLSPYSAHSYWAGLSCRLTKLRMISGICPL